MLLALALLNVFVFNSSLANDNRSASTTNINTTRDDWKLYFGFGIMFEAAHRQNTPIYNILSMGGLIRIGTQKQTGSLFTAFEFNADLGGGLGKINIQGEEASKIVLIDTGFALKIGRVFSEKNAVYGIFEMGYNGTNFNFAVTRFERGELWDVDGAMKLGGVIISGGLGVKFELAEHVDLFIESKVGGILHTKMETSDGTVTRISNGHVIHVPNTATEIENPTFNFISVRTAVGVDFKF